MMAGLEKRRGEFDGGLQHRFHWLWAGHQQISAGNAAILRGLWLGPDYVESFCRWLCPVWEYFDQRSGIIPPGEFTVLFLMLALDFRTFLFVGGHCGTRWLNSTQAGRNSARGCKRRRHCVAKGDVWNFARSAAVSWRKLLSSHLEEANSFMLRTQG